MAATDPDQHVLRLYHANQVDHLRPPLVPSHAVGQVTQADQGTGKLMVSVGGDPVSVPAAYAFIPGWVPAAGHRVVCTSFRDDNGGVVWHVLHAVAGPNGGPQSD